MQKVSKKSHYTSEANGVSRSRFGLPSLVGRFKKSHAQIIRLGGCGHARRDHPQTLPFCPDHACLDPVTAYLASSITGVFSIILCSVEDGDYPSCG